MLRALRAVTARGQCELAQPRSVDQHLESEGQRLVERSTRASRRVERAFTQLMTASILEDEDGPEAAGAWLDPSAHHEVGVVRADVEHDVRSACAHASQQLVARDATLGTRRTCPIEDDVGAAGRVFGSRVRRARREQQTCEKSSTARRQREVKLAYGLVSSAWGSAGHRRLRGPSGGSASTEQEHERETCNLGLRPPAVVPQPLAVVAQPPAVVRRRRSSSCSSSCGLGYVPLVTTRTNPSAVARRLLVAGIVDCGLGHGGSSFASDGRARGRSPSLRA